MVLGTLRVVVCDDVCVLLLAKQIYNSNTLIEKIDQFYFEHHVNMEEIAPCGILL